MAGKKRKNNKVLRMNKAFRINSALIIFGVILLYVLASIFLSLRKEPITTYKVNSSNINNNITCDAVALRSEKEITAGKSGYVCYYVRDGERVAKNAAVCTVDETGSLIQSISLVPEGTSIFTARDYLEIRGTIDNFKSGYSDNAFYNIYNFRKTIESKVLEMSNQILMKEYRTQGPSVQATIMNMVAPESGIITYYTDGYEKLTPETLKAEDFDRSRYERNILKAGDIVEAGSIIYKILSNEEWNICCRITIDQANTLLDENRLLYTINNSDILMSSNYDLIRMNDDSYVLTLPMNKYMIDYVEERFLTVEIILDDFAGLKVPNTAILDKDVLLVPEEYMTAGGNETGVNKLYVRSVGEDGEPTVSEASPEIYRYDKEKKLYYVGADSLPDGAVLIKPDSTDTLAVSTLDRDKLKGVYQANKGVADFTEITVVKYGDEFTIVTDGEGLREYDNIVMDANGVIENQILY
ncbi:MAG: hypothetical protein IKQ49_00885 [Eubacterium sp.]|nr:hypothetical protein [Eubacterium sp.]